MRTVQFIAQSWQGIHRDSNKDGFHVIRSGDYVILLLFDGVSGSENARAAVDTVIDFCIKSHAMYYKNSDFNLAHFLEDMNVCILRMRNKESLTTCCVVYIPLTSAIPIKITHLGDSRIYGVDHDMVLYTEDHCDPEIRHMLTKCLGLERLQQEDFYEKNISDPVRRLLLCTDGFYEVMGTDSSYFLNLFRTSDLRSIKEKIAQLIPVQNSDDATYILADIV